MFKKIVLLLISCCICCGMAIENSTRTIDDTNGRYVMTMFERKSKANLVSFGALDQDIKLGLKFQLPFLKVPIKKKIVPSGNEPALININTAALLSTSLLASSSALISLIFRKYVLLGKEDSSSEKRRSTDSIFGHDFRTVLDNFKFVYTNSSGARIDTSLAGLSEVINEIFESSNFDLSSCVQKALCTRIQLSARRVNNPNSSGVDKIIDGLLGIGWLRHFLRHTSLKGAIDSRNTISLSNHKQTSIYCETNYPKCKLSGSEDNVIDIIRTYFKFT